MNFDCVNGEAWEDFSHPITASECVVIGFEAKLVIFIARLIIIQYCTECFYVSLAIHHDGSVSAHILLSWENKLSVAFEWDSLTCRNMFFIDFFSAFILALNRVRKEEERRKKCFIKAAAWVTRSAQLINSAFLFYVAVKRLSGVFNASTYHDM